MYFPDNHSQKPSPPQLSQRETSIPVAKKAKYNSNFIDLTSSDGDELNDLDEKELDKFIINPKIKQPKQQLSSVNRLVCFGTLYTSCVYPDMDVVRSLLASGPPDIRVHISVTSSRKGLKVSTVKSASNEAKQVGLIEANATFVMLEFIKLLQIVPLLHLGRGVSPDNKIILSLTVKGPINLALTIGQAFEKHELYFSKPTMFPKLEFVNPHQLEQPDPELSYFDRSQKLPQHNEPAFGQNKQLQMNMQARYPGAPANRAPMNAIVRDDSQAIKGQIDAIYNSLSPAEDLPEVEADERLLTKLFKHQKQALYFMIERERELAHIPLASSVSRTTSITTAESMTLWRRDDETGAIKNIITRELWDRKGIDDYDPSIDRDGPFMLRGGLGKTIEAISLILHNPNALMPDASSSDDQEDIKSPGSSILAHKKAKDEEMRKFTSLFNPAPIQKKKIPKPVTPALYPAQATSASTFNPGKKSKSAQKTLPPRKLALSKATLIVCPLSTINNWEEQIGAHIVRGSLKVYVYHGPQRTVDPSTLTRYDIVLTTYNLLSLEFNKEIKSLDDLSKNPYESPLHRIKWRRIMLDEAHTIKEAGTSQARSACALATDLRWCLTGTPIQNKLEDLYSLLKFLKVEPFSIKSVWNKHFGKVRAESQEIGVSQLQTLMKSLTLRRTKQTKIKGVPIIQLPGRSDYVVKIELSEAERKFYNRIEDKAFQVLESQNQTSYVHLLELMLRLRQSCVHIALCKDYESQLEGLDDTDLPDLTPARLAHLHMLLKDADDDNCCFCGTRAPDNLLESDNERAPFITKCGHMFCTDCTKNVFGAQPKVVCPLCQTHLLKSEVCRVGAEEEEEMSGDEISITGAADDTEGNEASRGLSTKVNTLINDLAATRDSCLREDILPVKSIVFSQWTQVLDLIESFDFQFARLDGKMNRIQRTAQLSKFKSNRYCNVLLISIRAGGVGLNLTHASRVYIMEPYWNPAVEQQAIDRVHRMGQTLPVQCIRFIVRDSIEESMVESQERKQRLVSLTFKSDDVVVKASKKGKEELQRERIQNMRNLLFGSKGYRKNREAAEVIELD